MGICLESIVFPAPVHLPGISSSLQVPWSGRQVRNRRVLGAVAAAWNVGTQKGCGRVGWNSTRVVSQGAVFPAPIPNSGSVQQHLEEPWSLTRELSPSVGACSCQVLIHKQRDWQSPHLLRKQCRRRRQHCAHFLSLGLKESKVADWCLQQA